MITKGFVLIVAVIVVVLSLGGSWGIAALASSHAFTPTVGTDGKVGSNGKDGSNGAAGQAGSNGVAGSTGAGGNRGPAGPQGAAGAQGQIGPAGPSGASAPTFSAISASGLLVRGAGSTYTFPTLLVAVPAGPALVGFSVGLTGLFGSPDPLSCSLVDASNPTTVFATTASTTVPLPPAYATFASTQVVNLSTVTTLTVQCQTGTPFTVPFYQYQNLSIYAISFAP